MFLFGLCFLIILTIPFSADAGMIKIDLAISDSPTHMQGGAKFLFDDQNLQWGVESYVTNLNFKEFSADIAFTDNYGLNHLMKVNNISDGFGAITLSQNKDGDISIDSLFYMVDSWPAFGWGFQVGQYGSDAHVALVSNIDPDVYDFYSAPISATASYVPIPASGLLLLSALAPILFFKRQRRLV